MVLTYNTKPTILAYYYTIATYRYYYLVNIQTRTQQPSVEACVIVRCCIHTATAALGPAYFKKYGASIYSGPPTSIFFLYGPYIMER
jgi:hypothetical protein